MTQKTKMIASLGLVAGLGACVLPMASYAADNDTESADVNVTVAESITITGINNQALGLDFSGADISAGAVETGTHTVTVSTSAPTGYTLTMQADHADLKLRTSTGPNVYDGASGFSGIGDGTVAAATDAAYNEATLSAGLTFAGAAPSTGVWGYRLSGWTADNYVSVPTIPVTVAASNAAASPQDTVVTFGAQAGTTTPAGTYGAYVTYVAATNE
jgi:hypothetical protein